ncbi:hypothetical protein PLESTB_001159100 [Pleodorina starrii]|uniref:non-specific serine/threonine protein kinase n=1 Tax=Pleodorina starrii TaxID=330485 RepID=A0A9W6F5D8_9CHLO|nr:hypothetical protein PLESTM_000235700 [Pleodorina starrii]GLC56879.1 hypothetical protein PLESTB_001159100 [Pleodorina starrii]GLC64717.1 hypothetical protein PLESTF_000199900 [Pleodorina starrii]
MASDRYERRQCIGRGSFGDVYEGVDTETGQAVAIKVIDLEDVADDIQDVHKEIQALAGCKCKNITEYYGSVVRSGSAELHIIMELMACSVTEMVQHGPLDEPCIAFILSQVLNALVYLHAEHRIHRDIKAANLLLSHTGEVKITDFGVSGQLTGTLGYRRRTFVGTPFWMAPEVIDTSEEGYSEKADVWSLGITAIEMATGAPPHASIHPMRVLFLIPKGPPPQLEGDFSPEMKDFVATCLRKDPASRPAAKDLLKHPFVAGATVPPDHLPAMVQELVRHKKPIVTRRDVEDSLAAGGTMPAWDFGTVCRKGGAAAAAAAAVPAGTVRAVAAAMAAVSSGSTVRNGDPLREALRLQAAAQQQGQAQGQAQQQLPAAGSAAAARVETISRKAGAALMEALGSPNGSGAVAAGSAAAALPPMPSGGRPSVSSPQHQGTPLASPGARPNGRGGAVSPSLRPLGIGTENHSSPLPSQPQQQQQRGGSVPGEKFPTMSSAEARMYRDLVTKTSQLGGGPGGRGGGADGTTAEGLVRNSLSFGAPLPAGTPPAAISAAAAATLSAGGKNVIRYGDPWASDFSSDCSSGQRRTQAASGDGAADADYGTAQSRTVGAGSGTASIAASSGSASHNAGSSQRSSGATHSGAGGTATVLGSSSGGYGTVQSRKQIGVPVDGNYPGPAAGAAGGRPRGVATADGAPAGAGAGGGAAAAASGSLGAAGTLVDSRALVGLVAREGSPADSAAVLSRLLSPCLRASFNSADKASQALLAGVLGNLSQLEKMMPGASYRLVQELLVRLSCSSDPALQPLCASAIGLYATHVSAADNGAGATVSAVGATVGRGGSNNSSANGSLAGAPHSLHRQQRSVPDMGPLGEFLLGRWREEEAHELAMLAKSMSSSALGRR